MPLISVIVPVYRAEAYLDRCVESLLAQTFRDFELILVDDGSPDRCPALCDEWAERDGRIRVIHKQNGGPSSARNAGLDVMEGDYVVFVDSDDAVHPQILALLLSALTETDADIAVAEFEVFSSDALPPSASEEIRNPPLTLLDLSAGFTNKLFAEFSNSPWMKLYRRQLFEALRFREGLLYEDLHLKPYLLLHPSVRRIVQCGAVLYYYYKSAENVSIMQSSLTPAKLHSAVFSSLDHYRLYKRKGLSEFAHIAAYQLVLNFVVASLSENRSKAFRSAFRSHYFRCFFHVLFLPPAMLSFKNKLVFFSTALPFRALKNRYRRMFRQERALQQPNNFLNYV